MKIITYLIIVLFIVGIIFYVKKSKVPMRIQTNNFFNENIIEQVKQNSFYRKEIITGAHSQVVIMNVPAGEDIGDEVHTVDQTFFFVEGDGQAIIHNVVSEIGPNCLLFVPAGTRHNIKNTGQEGLKLFTIYAPAQHEPGTIEKTKSEY